MSTSVITRIQENLQYPPLKKIDPNTGQVPILEGESKDRSFSQAAIPSILAAFDRYVQTDEGASAFLNTHQTNNWLATLFAERQEAAIQHISDYSGETHENTFAKMQAIAEETLKVIKEILPANASPKDVKEFFKAEKNNILLYLIPELHIGILLDDDTLDDESNKMEGIVSSLMHNLGTAFDTTKEKEQIQEPVVK